MHAQMTEHQSSLKSNINPKSIMCHAEYGLCVNLYILLLITHKEPPQKKKRNEQNINLKGSFIQH